MWRLGYVLCAGWYGLSLVLFLFTGGGLGEAMHVVVAHHTLVQLLLSHTPQRFSLALRDSGHSRYGGMLDT